MVSIGEEQPYLIKAPNSCNEIFAIPSRAPWSSSLVPLHTSRIYSATCQTQRKRVRNRRQHPGSSVRQGIVKNILTKIPRSK